MPVPRLLQNKVHSQQEKDIHHRAINQIHQDQKSRTFMEKIDRERAEAAKKRAEELEMRAEAARHKAKEIEQATAARKTEMVSSLVHRLPLSRCRLSFLISWDEGCRH